jgi:hypothetical protein
MRVFLAFDRAPLQDRKDADGRLCCKDVRISKCGVNPYYGREVADWERLGLDPSRVYALLRSPEALEKAAASFASRPLLRDHARQMAADSDRGLVVGTVGPNARFIDPYLFADLTIWSADAIRQIESGAKAQLSAGYGFAVDMTPGKWAGRRFDGIMRGIVGDHVALCDVGRAGADVAVPMIERRYARRPAARSSVISPMSATSALSDLHAMFPEAKRISY